MSSAATRFAPAEKAPLQRLQTHVRLLKDFDLFRKLYEAVNEIILILNQERQIVFGNTLFTRLLGHEGSKNLIGLRPGEALGCIHAREVNGCGTSEFCSTCGAVRAILNSQQGKPDVKECRVLRGEQSDAMDLLVRATPLEYHGERFTIFAATDISHEKRRNALERVFFHDLMNTAVAIKMLSSNLGRAGLGSISNVSANIAQGVEQLIEEIAAQRDLLHAENNELSVKLADVATTALLSQIKETYGSFAKMRGCELVVSPTQNTVFRSDQRILSRVIGNMIKNALETSTTGQSVTLAASCSDGTVSFSVHNPAFIPRNIQLQLFKRSFSTKGTGRGLGTYSMKLLTERYLNGTIAFTSSEQDGTTFTVTLDAGNQ